MKCFLNRLLLTGAAFVLTTAYVAAQTRSSDYLDTRSDSIDILHYTIDLNLLNDNQQKIAARTDVHLKAKVDGINRIVLDLKGYEVDSVKIGGGFASFTRQGEKMRIEFVSNLNENDESLVSIWYGGSPFVNQADFGRLYISPGFTYNIGVSFVEDPHNFGRAWFPCFDNFVERSTYTCRISTRPDLVAYAGGTLVHDTLLVDRRIRTWELTGEIPTYLASVASASFEELRDTFQSISNAKIPVVLAAIAADTNALKAAFVNLEPIFHLFEAHFGPYRWDRVGYVMVPFTAGAMEHATNIAFPRFLLGYGADGCDHTMAHELAHHWFGNLVTCETASEMWLNEGFAKYTEFLFDEWLKDKASYEADVRKNHLELLIYNHIRNGGFYPVSNIPTEYTYSESAYDLPADLIHNLRTYAGDSLFYAGIREYMNSKAFQHATSGDLREAMSRAGASFMDDFFNDWIFTAGWPHFAIDSLKKITGNRYRVHFSQAAFGNNHTYKNVPFLLSIRDVSGQLEEHLIRISGPVDSLEISSSIAPLMVYLNRDEKISYTVTAREGFISTAGNINWPEAFVTVDTKQVQDSAFLRVEHHFAAPDPLKSQNTAYKLSPNRYWRVLGNMPEGFHAQAKFTYNGRKPSPLGSYGNGWLDTGFDYDETKLVLLHRGSSRDDWHAVTATRNTLASLTDMFGNIVVDTLKPGEYVFAMLDSSLMAVNEVPKGLGKASLRILPNPATEQIELRFYFQGTGRAEHVTILDQTGRVVRSIQIEQEAISSSISIKQIPAGIYIARVQSTDGQVVSGVFVVQHP